MLSWALSFLVIAIIAGVLGFRGIAGVATDIARVLFFVFLILFIVGLVVGGWSGPAPGAIRPACTNGVAAHLLAVTLPSAVLDRALR